MSAGLSTLKTIKGRTVPGVTSMYSFSSLYRVLSAHNFASQGYEHCRGSPPSQVVGHWKQNFRVLPQTAPSIEIQYSLFRTWIKDISYTSRADALETYTFWWQLKSKMITDLLKVCSHTKVHLFDGQNSSDFMMARFTWRWAINYESVPRTAVPHISS